MNVHWRVRFGTTICANVNEWVQLESGINYTLRYWVLSQYVFCNEISRNSIIYHALNLRVWILHFFEQKQMTFLVQLLFNPSQQDAHTFILFIFLQTIVNSVYPDTVLSFDTCKTWLLSIVMHVLHGSGEPTEYPWAWLCTSLRGGHTGWCPPVIWPCMPQPPIVTHVLLWPEF